jgi:hypothetical protein
MPSSLTSASTPKAASILQTYDVTAEMLTASLQTIGNAAKKIISLIENSGEQIEEGEGEQSPAPLAVPA